MGLLRHILEGILGCDHKWRYYYSPNTKDLTSCYSKFWGEGVTDDGESNRRVCTKCGEEEHKEFFHSY